MRFLATLLFCSFVLPAKAELAWQASMETAIGTTENERQAGSGRYVCHDGSPSRLPFRPRVTATSLETRWRVSVLVNDRGPGVKGRCLDPDRAAANAIGRAARCGSGTSS